MGKVTGFLEYERLEEGYEPVPQRVKNWKEFVIGLNEEQSKTAGRALHGLRHAVLQQRLPGQQHHPGLQRPGVPRRLAQRDHRAALDQQLPRVHRPRLPGAVRSGVHAERQRRSGRHQVIEHAIIDRAWAEGWVKPQPPKCEDRQEGGRRRLRPCGPGRRAATRARRPRRDAVREEQPHRRPAALRHPRLQDGEDAHRPPRRADAGRGRDVQDRRAGRCDPERQQGHQRRQGNDHARAVEGRVRRRAAHRRRRAVTRPAGARPRSRRRALRDGVPAAAEQARGRRQTQDPDSRRWQTRHRHRRRRHRQRLRRHQQPPRRRQRDAVRS